MGKRSATKSIVGIFGAFITKRTWSQAALARHLELSPEAVRKILQEIDESGKIPLTSEKDHPHVYWSVPKTWFPGGVYYKAEEVPALLRQLSHLRRSKARERLLEIALDQLSVHAEPKKQNTDVSLPV